MDIIFDRPLTGGYRTIPLLRGAIAGMFPDLTPLHNHTDTGVIYRYPVVQYGIEQHVALMLGIKEGVQVINQIAPRMVGASLRIGEESYTAVDVNTRYCREPFALTSQPNAYTFLSPWLALNQQNYREWNEANDLERRRKLQSILTGNLLSAAKSLGITIHDTIMVSYLDVQQRTARLKGKQVLAFTGGFDVNLRLPACIGIGKSVSRGFGRIMPAEQAAQIQE